MMWNISPQFAARQKYRKVANKKSPEGSGLFIIGSNIIRGERVEEKR
jgi:hypothetical protein